MKNYNKTVKSDGYIKNQNIRLRNMRIAISLKMSLVAVPLTMLLVFFSVLILSTPSPEKWERSQITYSDIFNDIGICSWIRARNRNDRIVNRRIFAYAQTVVTDEAEKQNNQRHYGGQHGTFDA